MNRRIAFITMLGLCFVLGVSAYILVYCSDTQQMQTLAEKQPVATLSAPVEPEEVPESPVVEPEPIENTEVEETQLPETPEVEEVPEVEEIPDPEEPLEPEGLETTPQYRFVVSQLSRRLCIRQEPSTQAKILDFLYTGQSGDVIEISEEWVKINYQGIEGYCFKEYLTLEELPQS